ncbi:hypothetical protein LY76DRAFT_264098 [Colletotrichum caudatum]|nr:hypothetical protein LY76DRAFT_264098 [Colletotrichum caudatum]
MRRRNCTFQSPTQMVSHGLCPSRFVRSGTAVPRVGVQTDHSKSTHGRLRTEAGGVSGCALRMSRCIKSAPFFSWRGQERVLSFMESRPILPSSRRPEPRHRRTLPNSDSCGRPLVPHPIPSDASEIPTRSAEGGGGQARGNSISRNRLGSEKSV